jgi:hypothetical protein
MLEEIATEAEEHYVLLNKLQWGVCIWIKNGYF